RWIIASQDETTGPSVHPKDATSTKMVRETLSHSNAESGGNSEKVHESLKHTTKEHIHLENPPSSSRTLSSMKNIEDS
ncbi:hypothetical protein Tco_1198615, partial [Tanacetum coccineum]